MRRGRGAILEVKRAHVKLFARHMEANGRMRSTVARRLSTVGKFLPLLPRRRDPAAEPGGQCPSAQGGPRVAHPRVGSQLARSAVDPSRTWSPRDHALISLLAFNGLRISEALGADVDDLDVDRGTSHAENRPRPAGRFRTRSRGSADCSACPRLECQAEDDCDWQSAQPGRSTAA